MCAPLFSNAFRPSPEALSGHSGQGPNAYGGTSGDVMSTRWNANHELRTTNSIPLRV